MNYYRNMLLSAVCILLIVTGCKKAPLENPFYNSYLKRAKATDHHTMLQILDTMAILFQQEPPGLKDRAYYYKQKSVYYENMGNYASSLSVLDSFKTILSRFEKNDPFYQQEYPAMLLALAKNYTELKLFDDAITLLMTAQEFIENNVSNGCVRASYLDKIAQMMIVQGHSRMAIVYLLQSHKESQLCTGSFERFYYGYNSLTKISTCYLAMSLYDSAQYYCDTAMRYVVSNQPKFPERSDYFVLCKAVINGNIASIKANFGQYDEAERLLRSTIKETASIYPQYNLLCQLSLLRIYLNAGRLNPTKSLINTIDSTINKGQTFLSAAEANKLITYKKIYHSKTGNYKKALHFAEEALRYHDSVSLANASSLARDPGLEFEHRTQLVANELLQTQYKQRSLQLLASILVIILVGIISIFIAFYSKRTERHARMQEYLNHEIQLKNDEIKDAYTSLESSYSANTELMLTVAHDLKNPIVGITNLAKLLLKKDGPHIKKNLELIVDASINATELINNLMNRNDNGHDAGEKKVSNLMRLVEYCVELMKPKAKQKKQRIYLHGESANALINKNEMWRVITNIINNAIKFSPENTTIDILLQKQESNILLSVKDQGIGMPKDILEGLFVLGNLVQRTGTAGEPSYGLGLKISKRIVEQHKGLLWAESTEGKGSTFLMMLPSAEKLTSTPVQAMQKCNIAP